MQLAPMVRASRRTVWALDNSLGRAVTVSMSELSRPSGSSSDGTASISYIY
ncbi:MULTISPECIES: hypothetical protein [unclassified Streptomyces]|uniref:hypothetical protein n=1 Tax=unclassified Streptomyces TaxID=2593676 RepID=UPI0015E11A20|nr:hypothetical protein [Streptomyces sp. CB02959]